MRYLNPMRPKAIEGWPNMAARLAGWRRVAQQVWFCMWWTGRTAFFRTVPVPLTGAAQLRADDISSCCYIVIVHNQLSWATSSKEGMAGYCIEVNPCLLSASTNPIPSLSPLVPPLFFVDQVSRFSYKKQEQQNFIKIFVCILSEAWRKHEEMLKKQDNEIYDEVRVSISFFRNLWQC